jgi:hypothetical protein
MLKIAQRLWSVRRTTAMAFGLTALLFSSSRWLGAETAGSQKPLTNDDIVTMVQAGLPPAVVIEKIKSSPTAFDTSTDALVSLKKAGISGDIIRIMVNPSAVETMPSGPGPNGPESCQVQPGGQPAWLSGASPAMWYLDPDKGDRIEMNYEHGTIDHVGYGPFGARLLVLHPLKASLRAGRGAQFLSCINPTDAPLVHFSLDKNERNTSVGKITPFKVTLFQISEEDLVPFRFEKTPDGYFKIMPNAALAPGEYGFVPQASAGFFSQGERVYTFGVD